MIPAFDSTATPAPLLPDPLEEGQASDLLLRATREVRSAMAPRSGREAAHPIFESSPLGARSIECLRPGPDSETRVA